MAKRVLCFTGHYLPAYRAGGPVKTIINMVQQLSNIHFSIVTRDRDLGDDEPFKEVNINSWNNTGDASVYYLSPDETSFSGIANLIKNTEFDVLYLNSFFDFHFSIKVQLLRKFGFIESSPMVLAPRGEFSSGALAIKSLKKSIYIKFFKCLGLDKSLVWQASTEFEKRDIINALAVPPDSVFVAKDLPEQAAKSVALKQRSTSCELRLVFLSRISRMKNLDYCLRVLAQVKANVVFDVYGPKEDLAYWKECECLMSALPNNIKANYLGAVSPNVVNDTISQYDVFFFPTHGENYGHVIAEALASGATLLLSDQTPWRDLECDSVGWDLPLQSMGSFVEKIELLADMSPDEKEQQRKRVHKNGLLRIFSEQDIIDNNELFEYSVVSRNKI